MRNWSYQVYPGLLSVLEQQNMIRVTKMDGFEDSDPIVVTEKLSPTHPSSIRFRTPALIELELVKPAPGVTHYCVIPGSADTTVIWQLWLKLERGWTPLPLSFFGDAGNVIPVPLPIALTERGPLGQTVTGIAVEITPNNASAAGCGEIFAIELYSHGNPPALRQGQA
jgi:hypothetical protein